MSKSCVSVQTLSILASSRSWIIPELPSHALDPEQIEEQKGATETSLLFIEWASSEQFERCLGRCLSPLKLRGFSAHKTLEKDRITAFGAGLEGTRARKVGSCSRTLGFAQAIVASYSI